MPESRSLKLEGRPVVKQRVRTNHGRWYTPIETRRYEESVAMQAASELPLPRDARLSAEISLHTRRPLRGDLDNYAKSILDGLVKSGLIPDDRQIDDLHISRSKSFEYEGDFVFVTIEAY